MIPRPGYCGSCLLGVMEPGGWGLWGMTAEWIMAGGGLESAAVILSTMKREGRESTQSSVLCVTLSIYTRKFSKVQLNKIKAYGLCGRLHKSIHWKG